MGRRTFAQIAEKARAAERAAVIEHVREKMGEVTGLLERGRIRASEADLLNRRLDAIVDGIAAGLHVEADQ